ncbi:histone H1-like [Sinocyclocheilus anshuiensis]|uniref:histone H1-like n=1 Tax=Sinocyclocheilus anshuiensis TaxID=1608454 RepID=UPI0007B7C7F9|nr:PREDICTED: histone H1-like [Sinocyclocheilus anshuiensis]
MAETAPSAAAAKKKSAAKRSTKRKRTGPSIGKLIVKAVSTSKEKSGVSLAALKKALAAGGYVVEKNNSRFKIAVNSLVTKGTLVQTKGTGATKLNKKQAETMTKPAKKAAPKAKKPAAKKPAAAKKPKTAAAKKPAAKESQKKAKKPADKKATKSPKKAK